MLAMNRRVVIILGSVLLLSLVGGTVLMLGDNEAERIEALAEVSVGAHFHVGQSGCQDGAQLSAR